MKERSPTTGDLAVAITRGDNKEAVILAQKLLDNGLDLEVVVDEGLTKALESLDVKCNNDEFNLLEILLAGRAMMDVMNQVVSKHSALSSGILVKVGASPVVLGTIKGDVHDLGKNIVALMLKVGGYEVIDLGKDVEPMKFVEAAARENALYIGVSSLLTTTIPHVRKIKELACGLGMEHIRVVAGGAALQHATPYYLNVDYVAGNAFDILRYLRQTKSGEWERI